MLTFSVIIPLHNEEENIAPLFRRLEPVMDGLGRPYEVIFVDDGSTDGSRKVLESMASDRVVVERLPSHRGQSGALQAGFDRARGEYIITMDADLQNAPEDIPSLLEELGKGNDLVCGWRQRRRDPPGKLAAAGIASAIRRAVTRESIHDFGCGLRVFKRALLKDIRLDSGLHRFFSLLAQKKGYNVSEIKIHHFPRVHGRSKYSSGNRLAQAARDFFRVCFSLIFCLGMVFSPRQGWAGNNDSVQRQYSQLISLYSEYFRLQEEDFDSLRFGLAPKQLINDGANLKLTLEDDRGRPWLFKPTAMRDKKAFREVAAYRIYTLFGLDSPETHVAHLILNGKPVTGSIQRYIQTVKNEGKGLNALAPSALSYLLKAQVIDWLLGSHDVSVVHFLHVSRDAEGNVDGLQRIDHEDALFDDGNNKVVPQYMLCLDARPWGILSASYYYKLAEASKSGQLAVDWQANLPFAEFVKGLPDDFFIQLILPPKTGSFDEPDDPAAFARLKGKYEYFWKPFVSLKQSLPEDFRKFYDGLKKPGDETRKTAGDDVSAAVSRACDRLAQRIETLKEERKKLPAAPAGPSDIKARVSLNGFLIMRALYTDYVFDNEAFERGYPDTWKRLKALEAETPAGPEKEALVYYLSLTQKMRAGEKIPPPACSEIDAALAGESLPGFSSEKQGGALEDTNNVLAGVGYSVENFVFNNKAVGKPEHIALDHSGKLYLLNDKGSFLVFEGADRRVIGDIGVSRGRAVRDFKVNRAGDILVLDAAGIFVLGKDGITDQLAQAGAGVNLTRLAVNGRNEVYALDGEAGKVYRLRKGAGLEEDDLGAKNIRVVDIVFDDKDTLYILASDKNIYSRQEGEKEPALISRPPLAPSPRAFQRISVNGNGKQLYLLDEDKREIVQRSCYGIDTGVARFSKYHTPLSAPLIAGDENIYVLEGGGRGPHRVVRITRANPLKDYRYTCFGGLSQPGGLMFDPQGAFYATDRTHSRVVKISADGKKTEVLLDEKDGLVDPKNISMDARGDLYVSDDEARKVFRISKADGKVSVFADANTVKGLIQAQQTVFDKAGNAFIGDEEANAVFKVTPDGRASVFLSRKDGLRNVEDIAIDSRDFIYIVQDYDDKVLKVSPGGQMSVFADAGSGLLGLHAVCVDSRDHVFVTDEEASTVIEFNPDSSVAGKVKIDTRTLRHLSGVAVSGKGKVYVGSRRIDSADIFEVDLRHRWKQPEKSRVSEGEYSLNKICGLEDGLYLPTGVAYNREKRSLYIATPQAIFRYGDAGPERVSDILSGRFREMVFDKDGSIICTHQGGEPLFRVTKGRALEQLASRTDGFRTPEGITLDSQGRIYVADETAEYIFVFDGKKFQKVQKAGGGRFQEPEKIVYHKDEGVFYLATDGAGVFYRLTITRDEPFKASITAEWLIPNCEGIAIDDKAGVIYVSSDTYSKIYMLREKDGTMSVLADSRDGLVGPESLALDENGNLYCADPEGQSVFEITKKH